MFDHERKLKEEKNVLQKDVDKIENDILPTLIKWRKELISNHEEYKVNIQQISLDMEDENQSFQNEIERIHDARMKILISFRDLQSECFIVSSFDIETKITFYERKLSEYRDAVEYNMLPEAIPTRTDLYSNIGVKPTLQEPPMFSQGRIHSITESLGKLYDSYTSSIDEKYKSVRSNLRHVITLSLLCALFAVVLACMVHWIPLFDSSQYVNSPVLTTSTKRSPIQRQTPSIYNITISKIPTIESKFRSPLKGMPSVFVTNQGGVWLGGHETEDVVKVDIKGQIIKRRNIYIFPEALAAMENGDIITCSLFDFSHRSVSRVLKDDRERIILKTSGFVDKCTGVSVTGNQEILNCTFEGRVILTNRYGGNVRQIYKGSEDFSARHAVENIDGNIYISDQNKSSVILVSKDGQILSTITQTSKGQILEKPMGLVVDKMGNVLCADWNNSYIYIIDKNNKLRELVGYKHGIKNPRWLAVDNNDKLWITQGDGTVHVVQYLST